MKLNELKFGNEVFKAKKRRGRGIGSGLGKNSGSGHKGQKSRSGVSIKGFEGGQMPIHRRLPKRGFNNIFKIIYKPINLGRIQKLIDDKKLPTNKTMDIDLFVKAGLLKKNNTKIKILGNGVFKEKIEILANKFSKKAVELIEKNGGKATVIQKTVSPKIKTKV